MSLGPDLAHVAFHSLHSFICNGRGEKRLPSRDEAVKEMLASPSPPLFCTFTSKPPHSSDYELRGCIGTLRAPGHGITLESAIRDYAITASQHDSRFPPVTTLEELATLRCGISVLTAEVPADRWDAWTIGVNGITIDFVDCGNRYSATYLPEVAEDMCWTKLEAISSLISKAGYRGAGSNGTRGGRRDFVVDDAWLEKKHLNLKTYESRKSGPVSWSEFLAYCNSGSRLSCP